MKTCQSIFDKRFKSKSQFFRNGKNQRELRIRFDREPRMEKRTMYLDEIG